MCRRNLRRISLILFLLPWLFTAWGSDRTHEVFDKGMQILESEGPNAALEFFGAGQDKEGEEALWSLYGEAYIYRLTGNLLHSLKLFDTLSQKELPPKLRSLLYYSRGTAHMDLKEYARAQSEILNAQKSYQEQGEVAGVFDCLLLMATLQLHQGNINEAEKELSSATVYAKGYGFPTMYLLYLRSYIGMKQGEWFFALACIKQAHAEYTSSKHTFYQAICSTVECVLYLQLEDGDAAFQSLGRAMNELTVSGYNHQFLEQLHLYISGQYFGIQPKNYRPQETLLNLRQFLQEKPNYYFADLLALITRMESNGD